NPFAELVEPSESSGVEFVPPPPPPAPTFNPFENDPRLPKEAPGGIDPFTESFKEHNKTKVPLENVFSDPPPGNLVPPPPESDFNPFDLPQSQDN
ncbi:MAG: hypothetical protein VX479_04535, partial [Verrucomicrobiota bacterium]|nr:hypothetical protein [Verrucomicrobiota bacterium]